MLKDKIILGKTKNKAIISICINCSAYHIPHFNYCKGKKDYSIEFQRAVLLDYSRLMELKERIDLEQFFAEYNEKYQMTNWALAIKTWNEHNKGQIPHNLHKPYYINMFQEFDNYIISTTNNRVGLLEGMQIYCNEEVEQEPHFHVTLSDNVDVAIYFYRPEYLQPLSRPLTDAELDILINYINSKCNIEQFKDYTNWQYLIFAWNNQNAHSQNYIYPAKKELDESIEMPDFRKLNEMEK